METRRLVRLTDLADAFSTEALRGTDAAFDPRLHELRPHPHQRATAASRRRLVAGSEIQERHRLDDVRVQAPYCVSSMPRVREALPS